MNDRAAHRPARKRNKQPPTKRHPSERFRAPNTLAERWPREKAALCGFLYGQHKGFTEIAAALGPDVVPQTVGALIRRRWNLPRVEPGLLVDLSWHKKKLLLKQAAEIGIEPEEYLRRIAECVLMDAMYEAVTDGRYKMDVVAEMPHPGTFK